MAPYSNATPDVQKLIAEARKIIEGGAPEHIRTMPVGLRAQYRQQWMVEAYKALPWLADALENTEAARKVEFEIATHWHDIAVLHFMKLQGVRP